MQILCNILLPFNFSSLFILYGQEHLINLYLSSTGRYFFISEANAETSLPRLAQRLIDDGHTKPSSLTAIVEVVQPPRNATGIVNAMSQQVSFELLSQGFMSQLSWMYYKLDRLYFIFFGDTVPYFIRLETEERTPHAFLVDKAHMTFLEDRALRC